MARIRKEAVKSQQNVKTNIIHDQQNEIQNNNAAQVSHESKSKQLSLLHLLLSCNFVEPSSIETPIS